MFLLRDAAARHPRERRQGQRAERRIAAGRQLGALGGSGGYLEGYGIDRAAPAIPYGDFRKDHVLGNLVSNAGAMAPVLVRYLDGRPDRSPDLGLRELLPGDRYLLCTDGLSPVVAAAAIGDVLTAAAGPREAVRQLVALAEDAGAPDNISVIVIDVREGGEEDVEPVTLGAAAAVLTS